MASSSLTTDQLKAFQLLQNLEAEDLELLLERHLCSVIAEEQVLVQENDWGETLYLILEGMAKVRCFSPDGEEVVLSLLGPGDVFGEMTLLDEEPRSADVIALTPLRLAKFPGAVVRRLMLGRAALAIGIARLQCKFQKVPFWGLNTSSCYACLHNFPVVRSTCNRCSTGRLSVRMFL